MFSSEPESIDLLVGVGAPHAGQVLRLSPRFGAGLDFPNMVGFLTLHFIAIAHALFNDPVAPKVSASFFREHFRSARTVPAQHKVWCKGLGVVAWSGLGPEQCFASALIPKCRTI